MKIVKKGTIAVRPDGGLLVTDFHIVDGTLEDLRQLVFTRVRQAAARLDVPHDWGSSVAWGAELVNDLSPYEP